MALDPYSSPLAHLATELQRWRERAGLTLAEVAEKTVCAMSTISAYENGTRIAAEDFTKRADELYGAGESLIRLRKLAERVSTLPWFRNRIEVERTSEEIREYESYQIPGLLQTERYARAIISVGRPKASPDEVERGVALRMTRQETLEPRLDLAADQMQTPRYWAVIDESAYIESSAVRKSCGNSVSIW